MLEMNATRDERERDLDRAVARLEIGHEHIEEQLHKLVDLVERSDTRAADYRQSMREAIAGLDRKVDPIAIKVDAVEMTVKLHEAVLKSYGDREQQFRGAARIGRWLVHIAWMAAASFAVMWGEHLRPLIMFWK